MSTKPSDIQELAKLANSLLEGKEYLIGTIADRCVQAANKYPHDQAIRAVQNVFEQKIAKEGALILVSQKDFQGLYDQVSNLGNSSHFEEELGDLLLENRRKVNASYNSDFANANRDSGTSISLADSDSVAELEGVFAAPGTKVAQSKFVENGRKGVAMEIAAMGFANPTIEIAAQDNNFVVYSAEIDSRHGRIPFLIPAEIKLGSVLLPSVFVSGNDFLELNAQNIRLHTNNFIGNATTVATSKTVLSALNRLTTDTSLSKQASLEDFDGIVPESQGYYREFSDAVPHESMSIQAEPAVMPKELMGLSESMIKETLLESGLSFDRDVVMAAKAMVSMELKGSGVSHDKITIASEFPGGIILATNIVGKGGRKGIEVPVEIMSGQVLLPTTFVSGAVAKNFDAASLLSFANDSGDGEFNACLSDKYDMSFKNLYSSALTSAARGNFVDVEESLAVISEKFGPEFHKVAFSDLMQLVDIGFNQPVEKPLDEVELYIKEASERIRHKEADIKMSKNLIYLYPED